MLLEKVEVLKNINESIKVIYESIYIRMNINLKGNKFTIYIYNSVKFKYIYLNFTTKLNKNFITVKM